MPEPTLLTVQNNYRCFMCAVITALDSRAHAHTPGPPRLQASELSTAQDKETRPRRRQELVLGPAAAGGQAVLLLEGWGHQGNRG